MEAEKDVPEYQEPAVVEMGLFAEVTRGGTWGPEEWENEMLFWG
ncbi:lasso RiPP family leader peptide-containing protein [Streptomyces sp. B6B3]